MRGPGAIRLAVSALGALALHAMAAALIGAAVPDGGAQGPGAGGVRIGLGPPGAIGPLDRADAPSGETLAALGAPRASADVPRVPDRPPAAAPERRSPARPDTPAPARAPEASTAPDRPPTDPAVPAAPAERLDDTVAADSAGPAPVESTPPRRTPQPARAPMADDRPTAETAPPARPRVLSSPPDRRPPRTQPTRAEPQRSEPPRPQPPPGRQPAAPSGPAGTATTTTETGHASAGTGGGEPGEAADPEAGGTPGARASYAATVQAQLARQQRYPHRARERGAEGTGVLRFTIDARGHVVSHSLLRSTGHALLDGEIAAMLRRAEPFPPIPDGVAETTLTLEVPVAFTLR